MKKYDFGKIIVEERKKQGLSQKELAEMTGVNDRTISLWERGERGITITNADKIAKALEISVIIGNGFGDEYFFGGGIEDGESTAAGIRSGSCQADRLFAAESPREDETRTLGHRQGGTARKGRKTHI